MPFSDDLFRFLVLFGDRVREGDDALRERDVEAGGLERRFQLALDLPERGPVIAGLDPEAERQVDRAVGEVGDYIDCGSISGTIKEMGLFTTTLSTADGIFIAAPNSAIFGNPVKNYSRNATRRVDITVGISYGDSLPEGLRVLQALMEKNSLILKDPAPQVLVDSLADSSVNLTLRFWVASENYWTAFWQIKGELKPAIESAGLNIPFPQRVVTFVNASETKPGA